MCVDEVFSAQCPGQGSIIIKQAQYGHIGISKCIEVDTTHFGCKTSVLDMLSSKCSGKQTCEISETDPALRKLNPCRRGLVVFLEISYICIAGETCGGSCYILVASNWNRK